VKVRRLVRDSPEDPDPEFVDAYRALPDARDLEPWLGWARAAGGPVLYLGPGTGRLAVPLWREGVAMVGVDAHPGMIESLRRRLPEMEVVRSRFEDLRLERRFPLVIGPSSVLTSVDALRAAARHLAPGGRVGLELMNPHWLLEPGQALVRHRELLDGRQQLEIPYPSGHLQVAEVELRWPELVEEHLASGGLEPVTMRGSGETLTGSSTYFVLAARKLSPK
jgi:SAM-dependent methyltransferase